MLALSSLTNNAALQHILFRRARLVYLLNCSSSTWPLEGILSLMSQLQSVVTAAKQNIHTSFRYWLKFRVSIRRSFNVSADGLKEIVTENLLMIDYVTLIRL